MEIEIFFSDDSVQKSVRIGMGKIIAFGGVFVEPDKLKPLQSKIDEIAKSYGIPDGEELKWSPKPESWIYKNLHGERRTSCYSKVLSEAKNHDVRALVIAWDEGRTTVKGEKAFDKVIDFAFERISLHLSSRGKLGIIVADRPGGGYKQDNEFLFNFLARVNQGTAYVKNENIVLNILTTPSHLVRQLQLADLVTSITAAMVAGQDKYASPLFSLVKEILIKNSLGYIGATGLKLFPDDLINLYYHLLGEDVFSKAGKNAGFPLPRSNIPYEQL